MTPQALLRQLQLQGVELIPEGDSIRYRAPKGVMTPRLVKELSANKATVLPLLASAAREVQQHPEFRGAERPTPTPTPGVPTALEPAPAAWNVPTREPQRGQDVMRLLSGAKDIVAPDWQTGLTNAAMLASNWVAPGPGAVEVLTTGARALPALERFGWVTGAGALGGALTPGSSALEGGAEAGSSQAIAELLAGGTGFKRAAARRAKLYGEDTVRLRETMQKALPALGRPLKQGPIEDTLSNLFMVGNKGSMADDYAGKFLESAKDTIESAMGNKRFVLPSLGRDEPFYEKTARQLETGAQVGAAPVKRTRGLSFRQLDNEIFELENRAIMPDGTPRTAPQAKIDRMKAWKIRRELARRLNKEERGMGNFYLYAREQFFDTKSMEKLVRGAGDEAFDPGTKRINFEKLETLLRSDEDLMDRFSQTRGGNRLWRAIFRDAKSAASRDVSMKPRMHVSMGAGGIHPYLTGVHVSHRVNIGRVPPPPSALFGLPAYNIMDLLVRPATTPPAALQGE